MCATGGTTENSVLFKPMGAPTESPILDWEPQDLMFSLWDIDRGLSWCLIAVPPILHFDIGNVYFVPLYIGIIYFFF